MFHPEWDDGCPSCTAGTDELSPGLLRAPAHARHDATPWCRGRRWRSSSAGRPSRAGTSRGTRRTTATSTTTSASRSTRPRGFDEFNFRTLDEYAALGHESMKTSDQPYDMPGRSCFLQVDGRVFHTYSQYARGLESHRRLVLLPRPHGPRPPGGLGGAEGPHRCRPPEYPDFAT